MYQGHFPEKGELQVQLLLQWASTTKIPISEIASVLYLLIHNNTAYNLDNILLSCQNYG